MMAGPLPRAVPESPDASGAGAALQGAPLRHPEVFQGAFARGGYFSCQYWLGDVPIWLRPRWAADSFLRMTVSMSLSTDGLSVM